MIKFSYTKLFDSLGGYKLTTKDGKIAYYHESEGADSAVPFKSGYSQVNYEIIDQIAGNGNIRFNVSADVSNGLLCVSIGSEQNAKVDITANTSGSASLTLLSDAWETCPDYGSFSLS